jgi:hypothetical protein
MRLYSRSAVSILSTRYSRHRPNARSVSRIMPAIRTASSSKGKTSPGVESDADNEEPLKKVKALSRRKPSAAKATSQTSIPHNGMPTNTKLPVSISFPARPEGSTRLVAWNVCASAKRKTVLCTVFLTSPSRRVGFCYEEGIQTLR